MPVRFFFAFLFLVVKFVNKKIAHKWQMSFDDDFDAIDKDETHCSSFSYLHPSYQTFFRLSQFFLRLFCQGAWLNIHFYHLYCISHDDLHIYDVRMSFIISFKLPHDTMWFSNTYYSHVIICVNKITMKILIIRSTCLNEHCLTAERRIFVISIITLPFIELRMCANRTVP